MINRKLAETPVRIMNRMEEMTDLICEYNEEVQKQQQEIERLNNIINELEEYINEEYIYDELGMKIFDASKLQDKLQKLKGDGDSENL